MYSKFQFSKNSKFSGKTGKVVCLHQFSMLNLKIVSHPNDLFSPFKSFLSSVPYFTDISEEVYGLEWQWQSA